MHLSGIPTGITLAFMAVFMLGACKSSGIPVARSACEADDPHACEVVAARLLLGTDGPANEAESVRFSKRAYELRAKACAAGDKPACSKLAGCGIAVAVPLDLPKASSSSDIQRPFAVELTADGKVLVQETPAPNDEAVLVLAREALRKTSDLRAVIRADASVPHGRVIHMLDLLKRSGISKIAFGVSATAPTDAKER